MKTMEIKVTVLRSLEDVLEVFPHLTIKQTIELFLQTMEGIKAINNQLGSCTDDEADALLDDLTSYLEIRDFLAPYLALKYCDYRGMLPVDFSCY